MDSKTLKAALWYRSRGYSVIPVGRNKKALTPWTEYMERQATDEEIQTWWRKWPSAQVAIVCGKISGVTVVDADSEESYQNLQENFIKETLLVPTVKTSKGYHLYFKHCPNLINSTRFFEKCDVKNDRGYVLAPPSANENGNYAWLNGLHIDSTRTPDLPGSLYDVISQFSSMHLNKIDSIPYSIKDKNLFLGEVPGSQTPNRPQEATTGYRWLQVFSDKIQEGERDESLFHIAHHLFNGHMPKQEMEQLLRLINKFCCNPPEESGLIDAKIKSVITRAERSDRNIASEAREWALATTGYWEATRGHSELQLATKEQKRAANAEWQRLAKAEEIKRYGEKRGCYYTPDAECEELDWKNASTETVKMWLPFELDKMIEIMPGSIILFAGSQDAGKSSIMLNIARFNMQKWETHYFSSELNDSSFLNRVSKFPDITPDMWKVHFLPRSQNFADVIKTGSGNLNLIDYLEVHDNFYKVSQYLADIHRRLDGAIAVVALQKDPKQEYGRGGSFTQEKPILSVSIDKVYNPELKNIATISKFKGNWNGSNPNGKQYIFKILDGGLIKKAHRDIGWHYKNEYEKGV